jgi:hypothetical protein
MSRGAGLGVAPPAAPQFAPVAVRSAGKCEGCGEPEGCEKHGCEKNGCEKRPVLLLGQATTRWTEKLKNGC